MTWLASHRSLNSDTVPNINLPARRAQRRPSRYFWSRVLRLRRGSQCRCKAHGCQSWQAGKLWQCISDPSMQQPQRSPTCSPRAGIATAAANSGSATFSFGRALRCEPDNQ